MNCPYCRTSLAGPDAGTPKICEGCGTPHHEECFAENGGCTLFGCKFAPPDEPKIRLQAAEIPIAAAGGPGTNAPGNASIAYSGFGDTRAQAGVWMRQASAPAPAPAPARAPTPPPPPLVEQSGVPPPPPIPVLSGTMLSPGPARVTAAAAPTPEVAAAPAVARTLQPPAMTRGILNQGTEPQPKSRMTYIMLGIFLGVFGAHSFYAGYWKRGLLQIGLTVCTAFYGTIITAIWAIAEVCTVDRDINDVEFS